MTELALNDAERPSAPGMRRASKLMLALHGLLSYAIGASSLVAVILTMADILRFYRLLPLADGASAAVVIDVLLMGLFGLQHSVMARPAFKLAFRRWFGAAGERSTYICATGVTLFVILGLWQPVPGVVWSLDPGPGRVLAWIGFVAGWAYLFAATFAIDHFDLFGLRQVWFALVSRPYQPPVFKERWMYRYSRHPIMLGVLVGMWCVPDMTASKFVLTVTMTIYLFVGLMYEERDLMATFGAHYALYKQRVGMFFTLRRSR